MSTQRTTEGSTQPMRSRSTSSEIVIGASPREVFDVVSEPTTYPAWLVGARRIRGVDPDWPAEGSTFRHVIGFPPAVLPGSSSVIEVDPPSILELRAGLGALGAARVRFELDPTGDGTRLRIHEELVAGVAGWTWSRIRPLMAVLVWGRNAVSLTALRDLVEGDATASGATAVLTTPVRVIAGAKSGRWEP